MTGKCSRYILLVLFILFFNGQLIWAGNTISTRVNTPVTKMTKQAITPQKMHIKIMDASIKVQNQRPGRHWEWTLKISNTGTVPLRKKDFFIQATQIFGGTGLECDAGKKAFETDIMPGKTGHISGVFRYELSKKLRLEVKMKNKFRSAVLGVKEIRIKMPTAEFQAFTFVVNKKKWTIIIKNTSSYPTIFHLSVTGVHGNRTYGLFNSFIKFLQPGETQKFTGKYLQFTPNDKLNGTISSSYHACDNSSGLATIKQFSQQYY